jgi:FkbM family methyltransferase
MPSNAPNSLALANQLQVLTERGFTLETLYDVGANIGNWSLQAQSCLPEARIEMFEPLIGKVPDLDAKARHGEVRNGTLHPVALSDETGTTKIKILGGAGVGSSILVLDADHRKDIEIVECPVWRLDDFIAEHGLPAPDFIKIDSQAAELKILRGAEATLKNCSFLFLEVWARRGYGPQTPLFHELANYLYDQNFVVYDFFVDDGRDEDGTLRYFDAMFINRDRSPFPNESL